MKYTPDHSGRDFWSARIHLVAEKMLPLQLSILRDEAPDTEPSHAIENFRIAAGLSNGEYHGMVFQDSDVGKWIEAASYCLMLRQDPELEKSIDEIVHIIGMAQQPDGYLNTYFTVKEPGKRWTNLAECHELYCAGHLMEGAVAYYEATGKREFLEIMCRMADHIDTVLGPEENKLHGYPGHPEVELGLFRLYCATHEKRYLNLARYFLDERGKTPNFFEEEWERREHTEHFHGLRDLGKEYMQAHTPVKEQKNAVGHAVRAMYLYAAMAEIAAETGDKELKQACAALWNSAVNRKMYFTGGFGSTHIGEAFMGDYELPNDTAYAETCASVASLFFGKAMLRMDRDGNIADTMERVLYNGMLSGMSLNADRFFYVNPLEVVPGISGKEAEYRHVLPERPKWFACACCPPNMARLIMSLPEYCYQESASEITIHQYLGGTISLEQAEIHLESNYPWEGNLKWTIQAKKPLRLWIRIPGWAEKAEAYLNGNPTVLCTEQGYQSFDIQSGENTVDLCLEMQPQRWHAHPAVRQDAGCAAFTYGPLVYCFEGADNPEPLCAIRLSAKEAVMEPYQEELLGGIRPMTVSGKRLTSPDGALYTRKPLQEDACALRAIPYYAWANRGAGEMRVWLSEA